MDAMSCRCAPGHVVHHIPVSLLYWPWKSDVLKICTPAMQNTAFSQKWTFYARPRAKVPALSYDMWALLVHVWVTVAALRLVVVMYPQNACFCFSMCIRFALLFLSIYSNPSFHMHFYQCFFMLPLAASLVAPRGLVVGLRESSDSVRTQCLCRLKSKKHREP